MSESRLQEIVTKAVVGRAERRVAWGHAVPAEGVTGVLGVHVTNSAVAVKEENGRPVVDLLADCDLWVATEKSTKVLRCTCRNTATLDVGIHGRVLGDQDLRAALLGAARAVGVKVSDGKVNLQLEADVSVEIAALTRMWIKAYDLDDDDQDQVDASSDGGSGSLGSRSGSSSGYRSGSGSGVSDSGIDWLTGSGSGFYESGEAE